MTLMVFGVFFVLLALSVPICFAMGFATITPALLDPGFMADLQFVVRSMIKGVDSTPILAIPLFMLSGAIMATGGLSKKLLVRFPVVCPARWSSPACSTAQSQAPVRQHVRLLVRCAFRSW